MSLKFMNIFKYLGIHLNILGIIVLVTTSQILINVPEEVGICIGANYNVIKTLDWPLEIPKLFRNLSSSD